MYEELLRDRIIFLDKELDEEVSSSIIRNIYILNTKSNDMITMWISSSGGLVSSFFAIYDTMMRSTSPISTVAMGGEVCSVASVLLLSGTPGLRYANTNSRIMLHAIYDEDNNNVKELKIQQNMIDNIIKKHTNINKNIRKDKWFGAEDCIKNGIVDNLVT